MALTPEELLRKHNPLLVILPQDPARHRPWSRWFERVDQPRGDYHPCSVEFFLSFVLQRNGPRHWNPLAFISPTLPKPTGLDALRAIVASTTSGVTAGWELDIAPLKSQDPAQAWTAYALMLQQPEPAPSSRVYARYVPGVRPILQYWYLYCYNDAPNKHEGDWESVLIELDEAGEPSRAGYAGHASGYRRDWTQVERQGDRPVVYVARGSHAAYFEHKPGGHRTNSLSSSKGWIEPFESAWVNFSRSFQDIMQFLRLVDRTAANPGLAPNDRDVGELLDPEVTVLPAMEEVPGRPEFWWMNISCRWGSRHSRLEGTVGPSPPWGQDKWQAPSQWLDGLTEG